MECCYVGWSRDNIELLSEIYLIDLISTAVIICNRSAVTRSFVIGKL